MTGNELSACGDTVENVSASVADRGIDLLGVLFALFLFLLLNSLSTCRVLEVCRRQRLQSAASLLPATKL
jgi:hypothetical protein